MLPDMFDYYNLPWEWDPGDNENVLIKEYISHEMQKEFFGHTKRILKQRRTELLSGQESAGTFKPRREDTMTGTESIPTT